MPADDMFDRPGFCLTLSGEMRATALYKFDGLKDLLLGLPFNRNLWDPATGIKSLIDQYPTKEDLDAAFPYPATPQDGS